MGAFFLFGLSSRQSADFLAAAVKAGATVGGMKAFAAWAGADIHRVIWVDGVDEYAMHFGGFFVLAGRAVAAKQWARGQRKRQNGKADADRYEVSIVV